MAETLRDRLVSEIRRGGPLRFDVFMERALYEPGLGYYVRQGARIGREGDFSTSPEDHAAFGATLAGLVPLVRAALGSPERIRLVEAGAGEGGLLAALLERLAARGERDVEAVAVERGPAQRERLRARIAGRAGEITVLSGLERLAGLAPLSGFVIANELLDALPVRRIRRGQAGPEEAWVAEAGGRLVERWEPASGDAPLPARLPAGERCLAPGLARVVGEIASGLAEGLVLFVDYGYPAAWLDDPEGPGNPLRGFEGGRLAGDLLDRPGEIDLTAHVDFDAVVAAGRASGFEPVLFADQGALLVALGFAEQSGASRALALVHPEIRGGAFKCLALGRGLKSNPFAGLAVRDRRRLLGAGARK